MFAKINTKYLTGICMQELVYVRIAIHHNATWWLIDHYAHNASSYGYLI